MFQWCLTSQHITSLHGAEMKQIPHPLLQTSKSPSLTRKPNLDFLRLAVQSWMWNMEGERGKKIVKTKNNWYGFLLPYCQNSSRMRQHPMNEHHSSSWDAHRKWSLRQNDGEKFEKRSISSKPIKQHIKSSTIHENVPWIPQKNTMGCVPPLFLHPHFSPMVTHAHPAPRALSYLWHPAAFSSPANHQATARQKSGSKRGIIWTNRWTGLIYGISW